MEDKSQLRHRLVKNLSKFDAYPKTLEDFRIKTFGGASGMFDCILSLIFIILCYFSVTIISCTLIVILFVLELNNYLTPVLHEELLVDVSSVKKLTINFDITFLHVSCKREYAVCSFEHVFKFRVCRPFVGCYGHFGRATHKYSARYFQTKTRHGRTAY